MQFCYVVTLTSSQEEAKKIAHSLVDKNLAACVNIMQGVTSVYKWKDTVQEDSEFMVWAKTKKSIFEEVKKDIKQNHSYELPAIIMLDITDGLPEFLRWIDENTIESSVDA